MSIKYLNKFDYTIDSHNRATGGHNDFYIDIPFPAGREFDQVVVKRASIKKSYYIVETNQNTFILKEGVQQATITVPIGNYSASSFKTVLISLLNTASLSMNSYTYNMTIPTGVSSASTGRFTYTSTGSNSAFVISNNLFELLGFNPNQTVSFVNGTLTSETGLNFQVKSTLNIHSDLVSNDINNVLQEINTSGSDFVILKYECVDYEANAHDFRMNGNRCHIVVLDEDHLAVNLTLNVLITLMFYKKNDLADKFYRTALDFMQYTLLKETN
jgi:hypothetical protein